jgi:hypothetical protein
MSFKDIEVKLVDAILQFTLEEKTDLSASLKGLGLPPPCAVDTSGTARFIFAMRHAALLRERSRRMQADEQQNRIAVVNSESAEWLELHRDLLEAMETALRLQQESAYNDFFTFAVTNEPCWRQCAQGATLNRIRRAISELEEECAQSKNVMLDEAKDWFICVKLTAEDEREGVRTREQQRASLMQPQHCPFKQPVQPSSWQALPQAACGASHPQPQWGAPLTAATPYVAQYNPSYSAYGAYNAQNNYGIAQPSAPAGLRAYQGPTTSQYAPPKNIR